MALTYCKECGAEVSSEAVVCPKCGAERPAVARTDRTVRETPVYAPSMGAGLRPQRSGGAGKAVAVILVLVVLALVAAWALGYIRVGA